MLLKQNREFIIIVLVLVPMTRSTGYNAFYVIIFTVASAFCTVPTTTTAY